MSTAAAVTAAPSVTERAEMILREVKAATWPASREAMAAIGMAERYLTGELEIRRRLMSREMDWRDFDGDLLFFGGDPQREAVAIAADRCLEAAKALLSALRHAEADERARKARVAAATERAREWFA